MAEYIKKESLRNSVYESLKDNPHGDARARRNHIHEHQHFLNLIDREPAADVAPVRHGWWICKYDSTYGLTDITCSRCRDTKSIEGCYEGVNGESLWDQENYCPNCGAKMDLL